MKKPGLHEEKILSQLEELANTLEIKVRYEQIKKEGTFFPGGLCKLKGENILIINSNAGIEDKINAIAKAVADFDLTDVHMRPALRELLENNFLD
jgi:hypothetical protein